MKTLIIFAKVPLPGFVKTRLTAGTALTDEMVCSIYEAFLKDVMTVAAMTSGEFAP